MLAAHVEEYDATGRWMSFHLATLIDRADTQSLRDDERAGIVELILKVWERRRSYPGSAPLDEYQSVLAGLDRIGDERPWRFARIPIGEPSDAESAAGSPRDALVQAAIDVESLVRESVVRLLWLAARDARRTSGVWLDAIDGVAASMEQDADSLLGQLRRRLELAALVGDVPPDAGPVDYDEPPSTLSDATHAARLREMAASLIATAEALEVHDEPPPPPPPG